MKKEVSNIFLVFACLNYMKSGDNTKYTFVLHLSFLRNHEQTKTHVSTTLRESSSPCKKGQDENPFKSNMVDDIIIFARQKLNKERLLK